MNNLLILGAGQYGTVAKEIAEEMGCFDKIDFLDDTFGAGETKGDYHEQSIGKLSDLDKFTDSYTYAICAIGNAETRELWTNRITEECYRIPVHSLARTFVRKSAQLRYGDIIEPMSNIYKLIRKFKWISNLSINNLDVIPDNTWRPNENIVVALMNQRVDYD